ncbi:SDR family NAD(P)-dependent oxidoreductase [Fodinicola acaciae]|uniref:SDR family NAD(P)-dependent oxidoreductase n=1 Tax=Fodinicola acaciae TaxID=2681555 RepID=UPI001FE71560|nr:SDR family NAD(P)-dependent oxidoreductase [Fodinicola acaciae]
MTAASSGRVVVISGGTDGMGRALALSRVGRGDRVVVIGSNPDKGRRTVADARLIGSGDGLEFIRADLSSIAQTRAAIREISSRYGAVDALCLFANRPSPRRVVTADGLERTFALYYLSRYLLGHELAPLLSRSASPVIVNVAGVGATAGRIHWDDLQLERGYSAVAAQLQAGRANDLLGATYAEQTETPIHYVLYHPGFTKSGDLTPFPAPTRALIRVAAAVAARTVERSVEPIHGFIEHPPAAPLTAVDRGRTLPLTLRTLDPADAERLSTVTRQLLARM